MIKKYGSITYCTSKEYQQKRIAENDHILEYLSGTEWLCKCPHPECTRCQERTFVTDAHLWSDRKRWEAEQCTKLLPKQEQHDSGTSIEIFVQRLLEEYNIEYIANDRTMLGCRKELDIYIPSKKLAIECNGAYWHSDKRHESTHHYKKWKLCQERDIQLLTFWDDQINRCPDIVRSIILAKLGI